MILSVCFAIFDYKVNFAINKLQMRVAGSLIELKWIKLMSIPNKLSFSILLQMQNYDS